MTKKTKALLVLVVAVAAVWWYMRRRRAAAPLVVVPAPASAAAVKIEDRGPGGARKAATAVKTSIKQDVARIGSAGAVELLKGLQGAITNRQLGGAGALNPSGMGYG
jgi:hypothetical protein